MSFHFRIIPRLLHFKQPAGTSRGTYTTRKIWLLELTADEMPGRKGIGECRTAARFELRRLTKL